MDSYRHPQSSNLEDLFGDVITPEDQSQPTAERPKKAYSTSRTLSGVAFSLLSIGTAGVLLGGFNYYNGAVSALAMKVESEGSVTDAGKAEIIEVNMDMPPITLATATTKVEGTKVAFEQKLTGLFDISLGANTVTRNATVETLITIDPGDVKISYDTEKDKLTFSALDTALSTKVDIPTGEARTVDKTGSVAMLPAEWLTKVSEAIDGTFGTDNSKVPIVREMAAGTLNINEGLEKYADLNIVTQVDKECTPLIPQEVEDFNEQLKDNIRTAAKGQLLDADATSNDVSAALMDMSLSEVQKLVEKSTVEMPEEFTIGPDQENIAKLEDYKKSKFFTSTLDTDKVMACGVSEDAKLSLVDEGNE